MGKPSSKQKRILEYLRNFREEKDYPPTIRDIVKGCGISSTSVVDYNLKILEREGYIRRDREVSRGIEVLGKAEKRIVNIPLIGYIAAGAPIPVPSADTWQTEPLDIIEVSSDITRGKADIFALQVKGVSMIDAFISDGDIVLMQKASSVDDGEMIAAWLKTEEETTLKKFYKEPDRIRLQPANAQMASIYVEPDNIEVQGKVIGVIRQM